MYYKYQLIYWPSRLEPQNTPTISLQRGKYSRYECPRYDIKQSDDEAGALGNAEYPFIAIAPRPTKARSDCT